MPKNNHSKSALISSKEQPSPQNIRKALFITLGTFAAVCLLCIMAVVLIVPPSRHPKQLLAFGQQGQGVGQLYHPTYLGLDQQGNIYVADWGDGRINVFDSKGGYQRVVNVGAGTNILGLAVAPDGTLYVSYDAVIHKLDKDGHETIIKYADAKGDLLGNISGIALGPEDTLAGADTRGDVLRFNADGSATVLLAKAYELPSFSSRNEIDPSMGSYDVPANSADKNISMTIDRTGDIYALGWISAVVIKTDAHGNSLSKFGSFVSFPGGWQRGRFNFPDGIVVDSFGRIYVGDADGIQVFSADEKYLFSIPLSGGVDGMTIDSQNNLYVITYPPQVIKLAALEP